MTVNDAVRLLVLAASGGEHGGSRYHQDQCVRLAMQWPSLAAALADLLEANDYGVPSAFRSARAVMRAEAARQPAQPTANGTWCLCRRGPDGDGRGHLRGDGRCPNG
jgi:hypothetical protein